MNPIRLFFIGGAMTAVCHLALAAGDAERGRSLYQERCSACHSADFNGVGPAHRGVYGRAAARADGFNYSDALKSTYVVWDQAMLDRWLTDPEKVAPGQRMGISVPLGEDRADLIEYLKQLSVKK